MDFKKNIVAIGVIPAFVIGLYFIIPTEKPGSRFGSPLVSFITGLFSSENSQQDLKSKEIETVSETMTIKEKKARFIQLLIPAVDKVYLELEEQYRDVEFALDNNSDQDKIRALKKEYRAKTDSDLLAAIRPHPRSIVLAQAALESSWATSRFFVEANNVFGVWSFNKNEPRIAASGKRNGKIIWLKKYSSIYESVRDNYRVLGRGQAFSEFRALRATTQNPYDLVKKLDDYSEKGEAYGNELASVISYNKFTQYDDIFFEFQSVQAPAIETSFSRLSFSASENMAPLYFDVDDTNWDDTLLELNVLETTTAAKKLMENTSAKLFALERYAGDQYNLENKRREKTILDRASVENGVEASALDYDDSTLEPRKNE
ncbi:MAG: Bax protein [Oceanicoccus sp.]|jgi:Bax protein